MFAHVRANLLLLVLTLLICALLYPLALLGISQVAFREQAEGSIIRRDGQAIGSSLVAQEFKGDQWFQPRPSAASFKGDASSGSNLAANNPTLRDRVAQQLGPIVKYADGPKKGQLAGDDVEAWFVAQKDRAGVWARANPTLAVQWAKADFANENFITVWILTHDDVVKAYDEEHPEKKYESYTSGNGYLLAVQFFESFARAQPGAWPGIIEVNNDDGKKFNHVVITHKGDPDMDRRKAFAAVQAIFFDSWLQDNPEDARHLERVPADQVTQSGSGLDPDITLRNAYSQVERVVAEWSKTKKEDRVRTEIDAALKANAYRPLGGLVGGQELVNVLKLNIDLERRMKEVSNKVAQTP